MLNSTGDGTECEGVTDDLVAVLKAGALEHKHEGRTARVEGDAVLVASVVGHVLLALGNDAGLGVGDVVAVHPACLHKLDGGLLPGNGDGIGGLDITLDGGTSGAVKVCARARGKGSADEKLGPKIKHEHVICAWIPSAHHRSHANRPETNLRCGVRQDHGVGAHGHGGKGGKGKFAIHLGFLKIK